jgi:HupE / UreJ protein
MKVLFSRRKCVSPAGRILMACLLTFTLTPANGHEIPERVQVRLLAHEDGQALTLLIRVPLEAMRDIDFSLRGPGYLNFSASLPMIRDAVNLWLLDEIEIYQGDVRLAAGEGQIVRISMPSDRSFDSYEEAIAYLQTPPVSDDVALYWRQAYVDVQLGYPLKSNDASFSIRASLSGLGQRTSTLMNFTGRDGAEYQYDYTGDSGLLLLNPDWFQVIGRFISRGFLHIPTGLDHLLFLLVLVAPVRKMLPLIYVVTAFTLGHSLTLASAVWGFIPDYLWFPASVELLISITILTLAVDNVLAREKNRRWLFGFLFGLIHGLGFSFALSESLQYSGSHLAIALLGFNLGVEFGQLAALLVILSAFLLLRRIVPRERLLMGIISLFVAHTSLHWFQERLEILSAYF